MKFVFRYMKKYKFYIFLAVFIKTLATFAELFIPYVLEYMLDKAVPEKDSKMILGCGGIMLFLCAMILIPNIAANTLSVRISKNVGFQIRRDLFWKSLQLSGKKFDEFGLPSITSRMTVDSYNLQDFSRSIESFGIRGPLLLIGGIVISMIMDSELGLILLVIAPIAVAATVIISFKGIPLYDKVQRSVDDVSLIMRENITGIRVVKALSKESHEAGRFAASNDTFIKRDIRTTAIMSMPNPLMTLFLNIGLILVVIIGANRVNSGLTDPGVILAFLTYFNMILNGTMGISRVLLTVSKANASAKRVQAVVDLPCEFETLCEDDSAKTDNPDYIVFDDVSFVYNEGPASEHLESFAGETRYKSLDHINFSVKKGSSIGIIGPTGCGKTTIINILMRFYEAQSGNVFIDGKDIRSLSLDELRSKFGVAFQNDTLFADTIAENIKFGRNISDEEMKKAAEDACAAEFIEKYENGYEYLSNAHGSNFSGGQKQRLCLARALAGHPDILVLDDSSSALDYKTDAKLRQAIHSNYDSTMIIIAQRVSSIMSSDQIIVMDEGRIIGKGTHEELLKSCPQYLDIYKVQMGDLG